MQEKEEGEEEDDGNSCLTVNLHQTSNTHQDQVNCGASVLVWWSFTNLGCVGICIDY